MTDASLPVSSARVRRRALGHLVGAEARMVIRDSAGLVIPLGLPLLLMVMNGLGADDAPMADLGGMSAFDAFMVPLTVTMIVALIGVVNMPSFLAAYRTTGVLRRLAVTPTPPAMMLAAQALVSLVQLLLGVGLALGVARLAFGAAVPRHLGVAVGVVLVTIAAMYAVGMVVAAIAPTPNASVGIGLSAFFLMLATGGGFVPREDLPDVIARIGELLPFGAGLEALMAAWAGRTPAGLHLTALVATTVVAGTLAARWFRWDR